MFATAIDYLTCTCLLYCYILLSNCYALLQFTTTNPSIL